MAESDLTTSTSSPFPIMPTQDAEEWPKNTKYSDNHNGITEEHPRSNEGIPQNANTTVDIPEDGNEALEATAELFNSPLQSSPLECCTERAAHKPVHDNSATPPGPTKWKSSIN